MILITKELVKDNERFILSLINKYSSYPDTLFKSHMWLLESSQKRAIYNLMYGDYIYSNTNHRILDIGGGYSSLTRLLVENTSQYLLIDPFHSCSNIKIPIETNIVAGLDWYTHDPEEYDTVFANDLFPNTDQRLRLFLEKYIKVSHKIVLSLTFHNIPKFYEVIRKNGDERMCMLAYSGADIEDILKEYIANIIKPDFSILDSKETVFYNGRQVCIVEIEGDI